MHKKLILLGLSSLLLAGGALAQGHLPYWAYPVPISKPGTAPKPDNTILKSLPGAKKRFTEAGVNDRFNVPDWYPQDHPPAPPIVLHGRKPHVFACGYCHLLEHHVALPGVASFAPVASFEVARAAPPVLSTRFTPLGAFPSGRPRDPPVIS